jgi:hypothetical protein
MNLNEAARVLGISPRTLRLAVERGEIDAAHPLREGRGSFSAACWRGQLPPRWLLAYGTEITKPRYQILSKEISGFQAHSEVGQYETRLYHRERPHQGRENTLLTPSQRGRPDGPIRCRQRRGGMLNFYARAA